MSRQRHEARVSWSRGEQPFVDGRYSRRHAWTFDGGVTVDASASPHVVPLPLSAEAAVDPEEALVASASSCHMLWFLSLAARRGFVVDAYVDEAFGLLEPVSPGRLAFSRIILQPAVRFSGSLVPTDVELMELHEAAHEACFIAASLRCEIVVESR